MALIKVVHGRKRRQVYSPRVSGYNDMRVVHGRKRRQVYSWHLLDCSKPISGTRPETAAGLQRGLPGTPEGWRGTRPETAAGLQRLYLWQREVPCGTRPETEAGLQLPLTWCCEAAVVHGRKRRQVYSPPSRFHE